MFAAAPLPFLLLSLSLSLLPHAPRAVFLDHATYDTLSAALGPPALLFITVRWCDHCRALAPELRLLARAVHRSPHVLVARVDADDEPAVPARLRVRGYPTILYLPPGYRLGGPGALEFPHHRWAEIMAEFVNNRTGEHTVSVEPREEFLKWRERNPFNRGVVREEGEEEGEKEEEEEEGRQWDEHEDEDGEKVEGVLGIREPTEFGLHRFDREVLTDAFTRFMTLFYSQEDPLLRELLVQWRQASSAFTGADNVVVGIVDIGARGNDELAKRYDVSETPACLYFPKCANASDLPACKMPVPCDDARDDTEDIIQFLSDRLLEEMGITPEEGTRGQSFHLTDEQYREMKAAGKVFANDPEQEETVRELYAKRTEMSAAGLHQPDGSSKDEL